MACRFCLAVTLMLIICMQGLAQTLKIRGRIFDAATKEPVPFASIALNDGIHGTISDINGAFFLEKKTDADSVYISCMGYKKAIFPLKSNAFQEIDFFLESANIEIEEVVVSPGENPAHPILRQIKANKDKNNPDNISSYQYDVCSILDV